MIFKTANNFIIFFIICNNLSAQNLRLVDVWHLQKGDFKKDSIQKILDTNSLNLKYNEIITIQLQSTHNQKFTYQYRIPQSEKIYPLA
jgi:hypothetical protein